MSSRTLHTLLLTAGLGASPAILATVPKGESAVVGSVSYEAKVSGAVSATLSGVSPLALGGTDGSALPARITLGAFEESGALVVTGWDTARPATGSYQITNDEAGPGVQVLVLTGSPTHPTGAFHATRGTITITQATADTVRGRFELHAVGYLATDSTREDRPLTVRGSFSVSTPLVAE